MSEIKISTIIGENAVCNGDFTAEKSARIDGIIQGNVTVTGTLIVGAAGKISGNVDAKSVIVGGEVTGDIVGPERIELMSTAKVTGDITTAIIVIDENAIFHGKCNMLRDDDKGNKPSAWTMRSQRRSAKAAISEVLKEISDENREEEENNIAEG